MSLISTYQGRKSLFAEKLEDKGVEASATDGLTTLINKIDDIEEGFTEGLLLYAENNIVQKEDTVDLYALLLEDGKPVPNKTVEFMGLWSIVAGRISHVPPHYKITNIYNSSGIAYLDDDHHFKIENSHFYKDDVQQSDKGIYTIELNQNNLTVVYIGGTSSTFDVSNYDMSVIETNKNMLEIIFYASGTTGSDGVASYTYTGVGEGLREVYAKYGTLVSEIYEILDTIFYCKGATSVNPNWTKSNATTQTDDTGTEVALNGTSGYYNVSLSSLSSGNDYCIEFDVKNIGNGAWDCRFDFCGANFWLFRDVNPTTDFKHYKIEIKNGTGKLYIDNQYQTSRDASPTYANTNVRYSLYDTCDIKYKNFVVYPI